MMSDKRQHDRIATRRSARLSEGGQTRECTLLNISVGGAAVAITAQPVIGTRVTLMINDLPAIDAEVVRHIDNGIAVHFDADEALAARLEAF